MKNFHITVANSEMSDQIVALHSSLTGVAGTDSINDLQVAINDGSCYVALKGPNLVGYKACLRYSKCREALHAIATSVNIAKSSGLRDLYEKYLSDNNNLNSRVVTLEVYSNLFTESEVEVDENDFHMVAFGVDSRFQGLGIGHELTSTVIEMSSKTTANYIFTESWEKTRMDYCKNGFSPIIRVGPAYRDGSCATFMGLRISR